MNGWIKYFIDGTKEIGSDRRVNSKKASWSRGRLEDVIQADLKYGRNTISIRGLGKYHQADTYVLYAQSGRQELVMRHLQRQIKKDDHFLCLIPQPDSLTIQVYSDFPLKETDKTKIQELSLQDVGKWLTLTLDLSEKETRFTIIPSKV